MHLALAFKDVALGFAVPFFAAIEVKWNSKLAWY